MRFNLRDFIIKLTGEIYIFHILTKNNFKIQKSVDVTKDLQNDLSLGI